MHYVNPSTLHNSTDFGRKNSLQPDSLSYLPRTIGELQNGLDLWTKKPLGWWENDRIFTVQDFMYSRPFNSRNH